MKGLTMEIRIRSTVNRDNSILIKSQHGVSGSNGFATIDFTPEGLTEIQVNAKELAEAAKAIAADAKS